MQQRDSAYLLDMLLSARRLLRYLEARSFDSLLADHYLQDALFARLTILGEAARRISASTKATLPEIDWPKIVGMRNAIVHGYDQVSWTVVWETVTQDVPALVRSLEAVVPPPEEPTPGSP